jgi:hypothetical protein
MTGMKEVIIGKIRRNSETERHGRDMMSGELKREEHEREEKELAAKFEKPE